MVHAYSLVHDDLPCMDDDDVRRGRATVHRVFRWLPPPRPALDGHGAAGCSGCCATGACQALNLGAAVTGDIVQDLMRASGAGGMIGGQLLDLEGENRPLSLEELEAIHRAKTGALITASATLGGRAARTSPERLAALARYGAAVGLAFQIADDVLDVTATSDQLGKTAGRDQALNKSTYPALLGVEGAIGGEPLHWWMKACESLDAVGLLTEDLERIARFTVERTS